jgi:hypothetical protein
MGSSKVSSTGPAGASFRTKEEDEGDAKVFEAIIKDVPKARMLL